MIVPEHPGYGASDKPEWLDTISGDLANFYLDFLDQLDLRGVHLVGCGRSAGCGLPAELAVRRTRRLPSLTLIGAAGIHVKDVSSRSIYSCTTMSSASASCFLRSGPRSRRSLRRLQRQMHEDAALKNQIATARLIWQPRGYDPHLQKWLHRIDVPTLLVRGAKDRLFLQEYAVCLPAADPGLGSS